MAGAVGSNYGAIGFNHATTGSGSASPASWATGQHTWTLASSASGPGKLVVYLFLYSTATPVTGVISSAGLSFRIYNFQGANFTLAVVEADYFGTLPSGTTVTLQHANSGGGAMGANTFTGLLPAAALDFNTSGAGASWSNTLRYPRDATLLALSGTLANGAGSYNTPGGSAAELFDVGDVGGPLSLAAEWLNVTGAGSSAIAGTATVGTTLNQQIALAFAADTGDTADRVSSPASTVVPGKGPRGLRERRYFPDYRPYRDRVLSDLPLSYISLDRDTPWDDIRKSVWADNGGVLYQNHRNLIRSEPGASASFSRFNPDYLTTSNVFGGVPAELTVECWLTIDIAPGTFEQYYLCVARECGTSLVYESDSGSNLILRFGDYLSGTDAQAFVDLGVGVTHHIVGYSDGFTSYLYVDGILVANSFIGPGFNFANNTTYWGADIESSGQGSHVTLDELALYDYQLNATQVLQHYNIGWAASGPSGPAPASMSGTSAAGAGGSGGLTASSLMTGTSGAAGASSGTLTVPSAANLSGTSAAAGSSAGALTAASQMTGASASQAGGAGLLTASGKMTGASAAVGGGSGALTAASLLSGSSGAAAASAGALTAASQLSGSSAAAGASSGTLTASGAANLSGTSAAAASSSGLPNVPAPISGSSAAAASSSGLLTAASQLSGSSAAAASSSGAFRVIPQLSGSSSATAGGAGALTATALMSGASSAAAAGAGLLTASARLSGASTAQAGGAGLLTAASALSGSSAAAAGGAGNLTVPGPALLSGTSAGQAGGAGSLTATSQMAGSSAAAASSSGQTTVKAALSGTSGAAAGGSGLLASAAQLSGSSAASATGTGALRVTLILAGTSAAQATGSGGLRTTPQLLGSSGAASSSTGSLRATSLMIGSSDADGDGSGVLTVTAGLSGASSATAGGSATMTIGVKTFERFAGGMVRGATAGRVDRGSAGTIVR